MVGHRQCMRKKTDGLSMQDDVWEQKRGLWEKICVVGP
jgi:hypothetical protein